MEGQINSQERCAPWAESPGSTLALMVAGFDAGPEGPTPSCHKEFKDRQREKRTGLKTRHYIHGHDYAWHRGRTDRQGHFSRRGPVWLARWRRDSRRKGRIFPTGAGHTNRERHATTTCEPRAGPDMVADARLDLPGLGRLSGHFFSRPAAH